MANHIARERVTKMSRLVYSVFAVVLAVHSEDIDTKCQYPMLNYEAKCNSPCFQREYLICTFFV